MKNQIQYKRQYLIIVAVVFLLLRIGIAYVTLDFRTSDYNKHLSTWYNEISNMGGLAALREQVGNYGILYQFLICLMTYLPISSLAAYKLLSLVFDILLAVVCGVFVYQLTEGEDREHRYLMALAAYCATLMLPTTFLNSSVWAQCDSIYTTFVILGLLCLCKEHDAAAFIFMGIALSFKLQAVFVLPIFLFTAFMRRRLQYLILAGIAWYATCIPGFVAGRSLLSPLTIYQDQAAQYKSMNMNFPGISMLLSLDDYSKWGRITIVLTVVILAVYMLYILYRYRERHHEITITLIVELACLFAWTCVEFLPCMHERYSYVVEILLLILIFMDRKYLLCLFLEEGMILLRYEAYLNSKRLAGPPEAFIYIIGYAVCVIIVMSHIYRVSDKAQSSH